MNTGIRGSVSICLGFQAFNTLRIPVALNPVAALDAAQSFTGSLPGRVAAPDSEVASLSPAPSTRAAQEDCLVDETKHQVVLNHLFQHQCSSLWIHDISQQVEGATVRKRRSEYLLKPPGLANSQFAQAMTMLNVQAAMTVSSGVIEPFLEWNADTVDVPLLNGLRIQILPTFEDLYKVKRHQYAAFIASEALLIVWDDEPTHLLQRAKYIEAELLKFVWKTANAAATEKRSTRATNLVVQLGSKINIISYIGTYYAIRAAWIMTLSNHIAVGLFNGFLDKWYVESRQIWVSIIMVFTVAGNVALVVQRHRTSEKNFCFMFVLFFGGMSLHISQALLCHLFSIDRSWGATSKEVEFSNFFTEIPNVARSFEYSITMSLATIAAMVIMAKGEFIPWSWNIEQFAAIFPLAMLCACHLLLPVALNPGLMTFSW
ncbi:hypothetical protein BDZ45DRAFT_735843 [Acephala macrosclerotiorum]|nr:hypothetical protein BDZ45DRAFT_735843 [Acephala macrosclerotiorum]